MDATGNDQGSLNPRPYQVEIFQEAIQKNTIVCLATGTGKTFISVMVIREFAHETRGSLADGGRRTFFLAPNVPLVYQQSQQIETNTNLKVKAYVGELGVDFWDKDVWKEELNKHNVLVMTPQIFYDILTVGHVKISDVNLLIFDECHNATKNHLYVQIMDYLQLHNKQKLPHFLGLTASVINRKCKSRAKDAIKCEIDKGLKILETTLQAACITCADPDNVKDYGAKPQESVYQVPLSNTETKDWLDVKEVQYKMQKAIEQTDNFFDCLKEKGSSFTVLRTEQPKIKELWQDDIGKQLYDVLNSLGVWCVYKAAGLFLKELVEGLQHSLYNPSEKLLLELISSTLNFIRGIFENYAKSTFGDIQGLQLEEPLISSKAIHLVSILYQHKIDCERRNDEMCAIVFTTKRVTAVVLSDAVNDLVNSNIEKFEGISSNYILGHFIGSRFNLSNSAMSSKTQQDILNRFRKNEFNVLISTSVIEEGIDVRKCNLVIRFDGIHTYREYVQSKGRARAKPSKFIIMDQNADKGDMPNYLMTLQAIEEILQEKCQGRELPDDEDVEDFYKDRNSQLPSYFVKEKSCLTQHNAIQRLYMYCSQLPRDKYSNVRPIYKLSTISSSYFQEKKYEITMPKSCPLRGWIQGDRMTDKKMAKKSAAMEVCKKLHKLGELDDNFMSKRIGDNSDDDDDDDDDDDVDENSARKDRNGPYPQKVPRCFKGSCDTSIPNLYLYRIVMISECHETDYLAHFLTSLFGKYCTDSLGIILTKRLPELPQVELFTHAGLLQVEFKEIDFPRQHPNLIEEARSFHQYIFDHMCPLFSQGKMFVKDALPGLIFVPLLKKDHCSKEVELERNYDLHYQVLRDVILNDRKRKSNVIETSYRKEDKKGKYLVLPVKKTKDYNLVEAFRLPSGKQYLTKNDSLLKGCISKRRGTNRIESFQEDLCTYIPLSASLAFQIVCLPAFLHRAVSLLLAKELKDTLMHSLLSVVVENKKAFKDCKPSKVEKAGTTNVLRGRIHDFAEELKGHFLKPNFTCISDVEIPNTSAILIALTTKKAQAGFNLERYEFFGDVFLKMAVSVDVYLRNPNANEEKLSKCRSQMITNKNLKKIALRFQLQNFINHTGLSERTWVPPSYLKAKSHVDCLHDFTTRGEGFCFLTQNIKGKTLSDSVEALIGVILDNGSCSSALKVMQTFSLLQDSLCEETDIDFDNENRVYFKKEVEEVYKGNYFDELEKTIEYCFNEKSLLIEAFSHMSSCKVYLGCYQRLEFLGDAILDFLVSCAIYSSDRKLDPGDMTDLRSAIVNNNTFSLLSLKYGLRKHIIYAEPKLLTDLQKFSKLVTEMENGVDNFLKNPFILMKNEDEEGTEAPKVLGDVFEALAGAIFLDSGRDISIVWRVYSKILLPLINDYSKSIPKNPYRILSELYRSPKLQYKVENGKTECEIVVDSRGTFRGIGNNKRCAKFAASRNALIKLT